MSDVAVTSLTDFLLARIAEDEADARGVEKDLARWEREREINGPDGTQGSILATGLHGAMDPARVLAECAAKRAIVGVWLADWSEPEDGYPSRPLGGLGGEVYYDVLTHLATVYADHPDYRDEWKP